LAGGRRADAAAIEAAAGTRADRREVSVQHCSSRHSIGSSSCLLAKSLPLFPCKEKQLVFDDRAADEKAEVVVDQLGLLSCNIVCRVEIIIAKKFKCAAVKSISPGFGDDIEGR